MRQLTVLIADARTMERRARRLYEERIRVKLPRSEGGTIALSAAEDVEEDTETGQSVLLKSLSSCRATGIDFALCLYSCHRRSSHGCDVLCPIAVLSGHHDPRETLRRAPQARPVRRFPSPRLDSQRSDRTELLCPQHPQRVEGVLERSWEGHRGGIAEKVGDGSGGRYRRQVRSV